jgi:hypothetical protein
MDHNRFEDDMISTEFEIRISLTVFERSRTTTVVIIIIMSSVAARPTVRRLKKKGFLTKQGALVKNWKRRHFEMVEEDGVLRLYYFKAADDPPEKAKGVIDLKGCVVMTLADRKDVQNLFALGPQTDRLYILSASSVQERDDWISTLKVTLSDNDDGEKKKSNDKLFICKYC